MRLKTRKRDKDGKEEERKRKRERSKTQDTLSEFKANAITVFRFCYCTRYQDIRTCMLLNSADDINLL